MEHDRTELDVLDARLLAQLPPRGLLLDSPVRIRHSLSWGSQGTDGDRRAPILTLPVAELAEVVLAPAHDLAAREEFARAITAGEDCRRVVDSRDPHWLGAAIVEAEDERELTKVVGRYGRLDLLCLDGLGYLHVDRRSAELLRISRVLATRFHGGAT